MTLAEAVAIRFPTVREAFRALHGDYKIEHGISHTAYGYRDDEMVYVGADDPSKLASRLKDVTVEDVLAGKHDGKIDEAWHDEAHGQWLTREASEDDERIEDGEDNDSLDDELDDEKEREDDDAEQE